MFAKPKRTLTLLLFTLLVLAACTPLEPTLGPRPEPAPVSSPFPSPTPAPLPSATISPSATAAATPTATPTLHGPTWQLLDFPTLPPARRGPSLILDSKNKTALLFGGFNGRVATNDLWSTDGLEWKLIQTTHAPMEQLDASMAYDEKRQEAVLFGVGMAGKSYYGATWLFNGVDWLQQHPLNSPAHLSNPCMAYDAARNLTILFGGDKYLGGLNYETSNETWAWNGANWKQLFPARLPTPRDGAAMVFDRAHQDILLFGGASGGALRGDTWSWDGASWTEQQPAHSPSPRQGFGMAYDESRGQVILFGGDSADVSSSAATDTWAWDGQDWQQLQTIQTPDNVAYGERLVYLPDLGAIVLYDGFFGSRVWELVYK